MSIAISNQSESFSDVLALNIKILQIIEKHNLEVNFSHQDMYMLKGDNNHFYDQAELKSSFVMVVSLQITKQELQGENFSGSALEDFLNIKEIISDPVTEVINVEARGEGFQTERYHVVDNLGELSLNLVDKEVMNNHKYGSAATFFVFEEKPQINLYIRFDPIFMLLNNSTYSYWREIDNTEVELFQPLKITDSFLNVSKIQSYLTDNPNQNTGEMALYSLYSLYLISQQHDLGLTGSFKDLVSYKPFSRHSRSQDLPQVVSGVHYNGTIDLNKEQLDIILITAISNNPYTINAHQNGINPLNTYTYARFLFQSPTGIKSLSAFEILPETDTVTNLLDIKQGFLRSNNFSILRTSLFLPSKTIDVEDYPELTDSYRDWVISDIDRLKQRWDKIAARFSKYNDIGFVPRIVLAIIFIKKYIWSHYKYNHSNISSGNDHIPTVLQFVSNTMGIEPGEFFGIDGYQNYFEGFHKTDLSITEFNNNRLEKMSSYNMDAQLYFPRYKTSEVSSSSVRRGSYDALTHIIVNDSYTKQAWKKKVKEFIRLNIPPTYGFRDRVLILTTENKLKTLMLMRILKDRPLVYQFSKFVDAIPKVKRTKKTKIIKTLTLDTSNQREIQKRKNWEDSGPIEDYDIADKVFAFYSQRIGFYFEGQFHDVIANTARLMKWRDLIDTYKKKIVFIPEKDFKDMKEAHPDMMMWDEFVQTDEFFAGANSIINNCIYLDSNTERIALVDFTGIIQDYFMKQVYTGLSSVAEHAEHIFYQFLGLIPDKNIQSVLLKTIPYFPQRVDSHGYSSWSFSSFFKELPDRSAFDYDVFQKLAKERVVTFTPKEINSITSATSRVHRKMSRANFDKDALRNLLYDLPELLTKSNYLNLNKEDTEMIQRSRLNIYLVDLTTLLSLM